MGSESPVSKLEKLCSSDSLSLETLRDATAQIPPEDESLRSSLFLHHACLNENVTLEIVEFLLDFHPGAAEILDESREFEYWASNDDVVSYPLHLACYNSLCPCAAIELLVKKNPAALRLMIYPLDGFEIDEDRYFEGWAEGLPLHYYLRMRSHIDLQTVMLMVNEYPEALTITHREGEISAEKISPFHALLMNVNVDNMLEIVQFLIGTNLPGLDLSDSWHRQPLDIACANENMDPKVVELLLKTWPESTRNLHPGRFENPVWEQWGSAIKTLCGTRQGGNRDESAAEILRLLVNADPEPLQWRDDSDFLPLHTAALYNQSPEFCKLLVGISPDAVKDLVYYGTPLFNACICHPSNRLDTVKYLFDVFPEAIEMVQNASGKTPLECAVSNKEEDKARDKQENERVISFLEAQQEFVRRARDGDKLFDGRLPLHDALLNGASLGSVKLLFEGYPAAVQVADDHGTLPLDTACEFCTADIVRFLVDQSQNNSSWDQCDTNGNYPLHLACRGANFGVVQYLLEMHSPAVSERNRDGQLPIQLLCEAQDENVDRQNEGRARETNK